MIPAILFLVTFFTTLVVGATLSGGDPVKNPMDLILGLQFNIPLLSILMVHELGHYIAARLHRVRVTPPYFIPFIPQLPLPGTMGAIIKVKSPLPDGNALMDLGAAGPLAGAVRWYDQSAADFYSDLFPRQGAQNFMARDKELSTFTSHMVSVGATYELPPLGWRFLQRSTVNLFYDRIRYGYDDFRDVRAGGTPGTEPLYSLDADVLRLFVSGWF